MSRTIFSKHRLLFSTCIGLSAVLGLAACEPENGISSGQNTVVAGKALIGGPFSLVDHRGQSVTEADFVGKPQLIYFGFAFCPDVCPTSLQRMGAALDMVEGGAEAFQPIFITVDAERDTPEQLALYVTANGFPEGLVGLTGSTDQIEAAKKAFAVYGVKVEDSNSAGGITYDHTDIIYLMDKNGEFLDVFSSTDAPADIAARLSEHKKTGR